MERAISIGAVPFEVVSGTPFSRYGARVTFREIGASVGGLGRAFGFEQHPWGPPRWVGLRARSGGPLRAKAYHALGRLDERFELPREWPRDVYPIMASLDAGAAPDGGDVVELYLRKSGACSFRDWAAACLAPLGVAPPERFDPPPRPRACAFCVGLKRERGRISAITVYADWRALPHDDEVERVWRASLDGADREAYDLAIAGVRSTGFLPRKNWHAMLAWTFEANGEHHRAVSLTVPPPT
jgi:hypothetical protein